MRELKHILLEGRVEDAQKYFEKAVGSWPVAEFQNPAGIGAGTNLEGVLKHFEQNDPSGNNKYLMWMVKMYLNPEERGTSPNDISSLVERFHKNVDRLTPALMMDMGFANARLVTSPKNLDSYEDIAQLERVMDEVDSIQTRKEKETTAKKGVDKLYEDGRWLLVKPNTFEGSCYYGSSTKWCTASKDNPNHFKDYSAKGILFYIIDKTKDVGDFFKIALFKQWNGDEEWYDRADNMLEGSTVEAIESLLPLELTNAIETQFIGEEEPENDTSITPEQFKLNLETYIQNLARPLTVSSPTGKWTLNIDGDNDWEWVGSDPRVELIATPFDPGFVDEPMNMYFKTDDDDLGQPGIEYHKKIQIFDLNNEFMGPGPGFRYDYLISDPNDYRMFGTEKAFLRNIYLPLVSKALGNEEIKEYTGLDYSTWTPQSYVSTFTFKYPPRKGTMTQKFIDYLKDTPRRTSNQFYEDVLGYSRPRAHNNMFFSSIKDAGIVKMERQGRQFVYSLGPNYQSWVEGNLIRV